MWNEQPVYRINKIGILSLGPGEAEVTTQPCPKHSHSVAFSRESDTVSGGVQLVSKQHKVALAKTWGSIKSVTKNLKSTSVVQAAQRMRRDSRETVKLERRLWEEVEKMFCQTESFYFSPTVDLTSSIQRLKERYTERQGLWKHADDRFFWNRFLLKDLIDTQDPRADPWIIPVLHGYIHMDTVPVEWDGVVAEMNRPLKLLLISRRLEKKSIIRLLRIK